MKFISGELFVLAAIVESCLLVEGARILAVLPYFARSHHKFFQPVLKALARAGHEVVVYSPFPLDTPVANYTEVIMDNVSTDNENIKSLVKKYTEFPQFKCTDLYVDVVDIVFRDFIESNKIQKLLTSNEHFDLVVGETFNGLGFVVVVGHIFKAPVIGLHASRNNYVVNSILGNSLSIAHIPDHCSPFSNQMSFLERFRNTLHVFRNLYYVYYNTFLPKTDKKVIDYFPNAPPLLDMMKNISLVFVNDHLVADYPQPRTSNIIPVAGIHIEDEKPLPKSIQRFMDEAPDGVILFSLGTYVPDELQPQEYFDMYINVFRQLKQRVLWKTKKENIKGLPDNVMTVNWAPQRDILAHPKCVLFITHGGLLSQHETIHFGVPTVVIPQFHDQHRNGKFYEEKGVGVRLNNWELSEEKVLAAITEVLDNPIYTINMKRLSSVFRDRPMTPAETVVYWTEYVLRHGGSHLKPASTHLSWYQLALLDVLAVFILTIGTVIVTLYLFWKFVLNSLWNNRRKDLTLKKKYH